MKKIIFQILFLALILSAHSASTQNPDSIFNPSTYAWEPVEGSTPPNIDSIAFGVLMDAIGVWDQQELYKSIGFKKTSGLAGEFLIAPQTGRGTLVQIDLAPDKSTADVTLIYSKWQGNWFYMKDSTGEWTPEQQHYSSNFVPEISENINILLNNLHTASLKSDLEWPEKHIPLMTDSLSKTVGLWNRNADSIKEKTLEIQSIWGHEGDYAYEFSEDTINNVLQTLCNFATKMVDTARAKEYGARLEYFVVKAKKTEGTIEFKENGYNIQIAKTQVSDTTFIAFWSNNITLMPHPMGKIAKNSWILQFFLQEDFGVLLLMEEDVLDIIIFKGMNQVGGYIENEWEVLDKKYMIGDLQQLFLNCQSLIPNK